MKKTALLVVSGSIAAYKAAELAHMMVKAGFEVHVLMTANALNFINPITFESLTSNKCVVDTFDRNFEFEIGHISLARKADICVIAPATANIIGKMAGGIADDMATTTILACDCTKIIAPAMNTHMYENPVVQENLEKLKRLGYALIEPESGLLACGDSGRGRLAPVSDIFENIMLRVSHEHDLKGLRVLVSAGPTRENIDPVRFITNHSSGKMGYALARTAARRGAEVLLVHGHTSLKDPQGVECVQVGSAAEMASEILKAAHESDIVIMAAAVADYTPVTSNSQKIKKADGELNLSLKRTEDILERLVRERKDGQFICGFSMETENLLENSIHKLEKKGCDMICANCLMEKGAGFEVDTNVLSIITADGQEQLGLMSKDEASGRIFDRILEMKDRKQPGDR